MPSMGSLYPHRAAGMATGPAWLLPGVHITLIQATVFGELNGHPGKSYVFI